MAGKQAVQQPKISSVHTVTRCLPTLQPGMGQRPGKFVPQADWKAAFNTAAFNAAALPTCWASQTQKIVSIKAQSDVRRMACHT